MKTVKLWIVIGCIVGLASCVPSLHGIYTEDTMVVDDRILGNWQTGGGPEIKLTELDIKIETDDPEERKSIPELKKDLEKSAMEKLAGLNREGTIWKFERAGDITWNMNIEGGTGTANINPGCPSMIENGQVIKNIPYDFYILSIIDNEEEKSKPERLLVHLTKIEESVYMDFMPYVLEKENASRFAKNSIPGHSFARLEFQEDGLKIRPFDGNYIRKLIESKRIRLKHEKLDGDRIVLTASTRELRSFIKKYGDDPRLYDRPEELTAL